MLILSKMTGLALLLCKIVKGAQYVPDESRIESTAYKKLESIANHELIDFQTAKYSSSSRDSPSSIYKYTDLSYCIINPSIESIEIENPEENIILIKNLMPAGRKPKTRTVISLIQAWNTEVFTTSSVISAQFLKFTKDEKIIEGSITTPISPLRHKYTILLAPSSFPIDSTGKTEKEKDCPKSIASYIAQANRSSFSVYSFMKRILTILFCSLYKEEVEKSGLNLEIAVGNFILNLPVDYLESDLVNHLLLEDDALYTLANRLKRHNVYSTIQEIKTMLEEEEKYKDNEEIESDSSSTDRTMGILDMIYEISQKINGILNRTLSYLDASDGSSQVRESIREENAEIIGSLVEILENYRQMSESIRVEESSRERKNRVLTILDNIEENLNINGTEEVIERDRKNIIRTLSIRIPSMTDPEMRSYIERLNRKRDLLVDVLIGRIVNYSIYRGDGNVEHTLSREKESIKEIDPMDVFQTVIDLNNLYMDICKSTSSVSYLNKEIQNIFTQNSDKTWKINEESITYSTLRDVSALVKEVYKLENFFKTLNSYDEIWESPIFLCCLKPKMPGGKYKCFIRDMSRENTVIYEREIFPTRDNLRAFRDAETMEDIASIDAV